MEVLVTLPNGEQAYTEPIYLFSARSKDVKEIDYRATVKAVADKFKYETPYHVGSTTVQGIVQLVTTKNGQVQLGPKTAIEFCPRVAQPTKEEYVQKLDEIFGYTPIEFVKAIERIAKEECSTDDDSGVLCKIESIEEILRPAITKYTTQPKKK